MNECNSIECNSIKCNSIEINFIKNNSIKNNSLETIYKTVLSEQTKFGLSEIIGIENYFYQEISQRKSCSKKLNKYAPVGIASTSVTCYFFFNNWNS